MLLEIQTVVWIQMGILWTMDTDTTKFEYRLECGYRWVYYGPWILTLRSLSTDWSVDTDGYSMHHGY